MNFDNLIKLYPEIKFTGIFHEADDIQLDLIGEYAHEVPYLIRAFLASQAKVRAIEGKLLQYDERKDLQSTIDSLNYRLEQSAKSYDKLVKAIQDVN